MLSLTGQTNHPVNTKMSVANVFPGSHGSGMCKGPNNKAIGFLLPLLCCLEFVFSTQSTAGRRTWTTNKVSCPAGYPVLTCPMSQQFHQPGLQQKHAPQNESPLRMFHSPRITRPTNVNSRFSAYPSHQKALTNPKRTGPFHARAARCGDEVSTGNFPTRSSSMLLWNSHFFSEIWRTKCQLLPNHIEEENVACNMAHEIELAAKPVQTPAPCCMQLFLPQCGWAVWAHVQSRVTFKQILHLLTPFQSLTLNRQVFLGLCHVLSLCSQFGRSSNTFSADSTHRVDLSRGFRSLCHPSSVHAQTLVTWCRSRFDKTLCEP